MIKSLLSHIRTPVKAGAYGIQGEGGKFVTHLSGDFENVVGLPTVLVREMLEEALK